MKIRSSLPGVHTILNSTRYSSCRRAARRLFDSQPESGTVPHCQPLKARPRNRRRPSLRRPATPAAVQLICHYSRAMQNYAQAQAQLAADASAPLVALVRCGCALHRPLAELFVCESCALLNCDECSVCEIDAYFCANCFATVTAAAAAQDAYRCKQCMECPQCAHVLSLVRDASQVCKFVCECCQWASDQVGLSDPVPTGLLYKLISRERDTSGRDEVQRLIKHFRARESTSRKARQAASALAASAASGGTKSSMAARASISSLALAAAAAAATTGGNTWETSSAPVRLRLLQPYSFSPPCSLVCVTQRLFLNPTTALH